MKIELKNISKNFKTNTVLSNINITFEEGKIYAFIGRNGSGKSVLMKIICGYLNPSIGEVLYDGKTLNKDIKVPTSTRCLIESPSFIPDLSGYKNLELLANIKKKIGKNEIEDSLKTVNLDNDSKKKYHTYSLGMKQKLGIAQVLMEDPKVIILDEPFNGIEEESVKKLRNVLLQEKKKNKIVILSSHMKDDIDFLADIVYKIDNGIVTCIKDNK